MGNKYLVDEIELKDLIDKVSNLCEILSKGSVNSNNEKPINFDEAMDYLSIQSRRKMHDLMNHRSNPVPFHKVGRNTMFFLSELKDWLKNN